MMSIKVPLKARNEIVSLKGIEFKYPNSPSSIFSDFDFTVFENEITSIVGSSGCGKSTLIEIILGLKKPSKGQIYSSTNRLPDGMINASVIFQSDNLFPWLTVSENIIISPLIEKLNKKHKDDYLSTLLLNVDLNKNCLNLYPNELSGGMKQKVALARCLATKSKILILDEPFNSLDWISRDKMLNLILKLRREFKLTIIVVTHDLEEAVFISDLVLVLTNTKPTAKAGVFQIERNGINHNDFAMSDLFLKYKQAIKNVL